MKRAMKEGSGAVDTVAVHENSIPCRTHNFSHLARHHRTAHNLTHMRWLKISQSSHSFCRTVETRQFACTPSKESHPHSMALLNVPGVSSFCSTPPMTWTPTPDPLTGTRHPSNAPPHRGGQSGPMADTTPLTGYEPKFCVDVNREHTLIDFPSRRDSFDLENDMTTTVKASGDFDHHLQRTTASGSQQAVGCNAPTLLNLGSSSCVCQQMRGQDSVASPISGIWVLKALCCGEKRSRFEQCADLVRKTKRP